jgi:uncharacterized UPF0160 family protein
MSNAPPAKRAKTGRNIVPKYPTGTAGVTIGTHNGTFHADEALACYLLKLLPEYKDATIVRSRSPAELDPCTVVVDVGGTFDHAKQRYDHHQRGFDETANSIDEKSPWTIKLSAAGLVYVHYGRAIIAAILSDESCDESDPAVVEVLWKKMYSAFIQEIDAIDNGVTICEGEQVYHINSSVSSRVGRLNSPWNDPNPDQDGQFDKAMDLIGGEFVSVLKGFVNTWMPARDCVVAAISKRKEVDPSGGIMEFPRSCPWKSHFYDIEKEIATEGEIKYVLYPDDSGNWRVQCVSLDQNSFKNRLSLPEPWRGVRDDALSELSGIPGCIFVHAAGFIGGNKTRDGAVAMAKAGLKFA